MDAEELHGDERRILFAIIMASPVLFITCSSQVLQCVMAWTFLPVVFWRTSSLVGDKLLWELCTSTCTGNDWLARDDTMCSVDGEDCVFHLRVTALAEAVVLSRTCVILVALLAAARVVLITSFQARIRERRFMCDIR
jgi:hypothetical protein